MSSPLEMQGKPSLILCEGERELGSRILWDFSWGLCQPVGPASTLSFRRLGAVNRSGLTRKNRWERECVIGNVLGERDVLKFQADCAKEGLQVAGWQQFSGHPGITYPVQGKRAQLLCG